MSGGFFWLAIFPMVLGGIILAIFILRLKKQRSEPEKEENRRITSEEFISEVAQYFDRDKAETERMVEFVFSYFPAFDWKKRLPSVKKRKTGEGNEENAKKGKRTPKTKTS